MGDSMSSVVISGDTSGAITLSAPAVAGTNTATLPAATGTVMVSGNMPAFSATMSNQLNVSQGTWTKIPFDTKDFDTATCFNTSTYRFTPNVAGYYQVNGFMNFNNNSGNPVQTGFISVYKNGSAWKSVFIALQYNGSSSSTVTYTGSPTMSSLVYLNGSTDYIELYGNLTSSGQAAFYNGNSFFQAYMVRSA